MAKVGSGDYQTVVHSSLIVSGGSVNTGVENAAASSTRQVYIDQSEIEATTYTVRNAADFETFVALSFLSGGPVDTGTGSVTCAGVWEENYVLQATCP